MFTNTFAQFIVAVGSAVVSGIIVALFEEWLDNRNDKNKKN